MTWIIVILLALILVALMSSNQGSAQGVKKAIKYTALASLGLFLWLVFIFTLVWSNSLNNTSDWSYGLAGLVGVVVPPLYLWIFRKEILEAYAEDRKAAIKDTVRILGYVAAGLAAMISFQLLKKEGLDGVLLLSVIVVTGAVLVGRSLGQREKWREIWFGPPQPPNIWMEVDNAKTQAYAEDRVIWDQESANWDDKSEAEQDALTAARIQRSEQTELRLQQLEAALNAQHEAWRKQSLWSVRHVFWVAIIVIGFDVAGVLWDLAYAYALDTSFVRGRGWLAVTTVIIATGVLIKAIYEAIEIVKENLEEEKTRKARKS